MFINSSWTTIFVMLKTGLSRENWLVSYVPEPHGKDSNSVISITTMIERKMHTWKVQCRLKPTGHHQTSWWCRRAWGAWLPYIQGWRDSQVCPWILASSWMLCEGWLIPDAATENQSPENQWTCRCACKSNIHANKHKNLFWPDVVHTPIRLLPKGKISHLYCECDLGVQLCIAWAIRLLSTGQTWYVTVIGDTIKHCLCTSLTSVWQESMCI